MEHTTIKIKEYTVIVSKCDVEKISARNWHPIIRDPKRPDLVYFASWKNRKQICLHRFLVSGNPTGMCVDHENGNTLDNRRENLRICLVSENIRNTRKYKNNTSGYKGVYYDKSRSKWRASITVDCKNIKLGRFNTPEEAHNAYCAASKKYHGEYGRVD